MFKKIATLPFWAHLLIMLALVILLVLSFLGLLGLITHHGASSVVPSVVGTDTRAAIKKLESMGFEVVIIDSSYTDNVKKGVVLKQYPEPNSTVKINRTVMLAINRYSLPLIDMPALEGKSLQFAIELLRRHHLKLGDTITQPDFMEGSVLEQRIRGDKIVAGAKVPWGTPIDLVIGSGLGNEEMNVPDFNGMIFSLVKDSMTKMGLLTGALVLDPDVMDTAGAYVWRQTPPPLNEEKEVVRIKPGQLMDLWLSISPKEDTARFQ